MRLPHPTPAPRLPVLSPILDRDPDFENGDAYLAELAGRAVLSHADESRRDAVLDWIN